MSSNELKKVLYQRRPAYMLINAPNHAENGVYSSLPINLIALIILIPIPRLASHHDAQVESVDFGSEYLDALWVVDLKPQ